MKFRNPKKVQNFYSIEAARLWYCDKVRYCTNCAFGSHNRCIDFCEEHPIEAAHIMELEVVEDKEEPMEKTDKPRICEVLGVEVGEEWSYPEFSGTFRINQDGYREYKTKNGVWYLCHVEKDLTEIINHPDRIIRKPRFTEEDVEDAKNITRLIDGSTAAEIERTETDTLRLMIPLSVIGKKIIDLDCTISPSLRPGQSVSLQEILEEAPNE